MPTAAEGVSATVHVINGELNCIYIFLKTNVANIYYIALFALTLINESPTRFQISNLFSLTH